MMVIFNKPLAQLEYTRKEIRDLLRMIDLGNRPKNQTTKSGGKPAPGLKRIHSAFGIVGERPEGRSMMIIEAVMMEMMVFMVDKYKK